MYWIVAAWIISLIAMYCLGYYISSLKKSIIELQTAVKSKVDKQPEPEEPVSTLIDLNDPVQTAIYEQKIMMEKLNGKNNQNS